jgi:hypothetical protein
MQIIIAAGILRPEHSAERLRSVPAVRMNTI